MKKYFLFACVAAALVSCSSDDFLGNEAGLTQRPGDGSILFQSYKGKAQRGTIYGSEAATLLGNRFIVEGTKGDLPATTTTTDVVFDNYLVRFGENTAGTTESNTNNWEYVNESENDVTEEADLLATIGRGVDQQSIKYWDYSVPQYDFVAYSTGDAKMVSGTPAAGQVKVTKIDGTTKGYSFEGLSAADLNKVYITDVVTVEKANYNKPVQLVFKNLTSKVRMAIYETVPGYSVKDVEFFADDATTTVVYTAATLPADQTALDAANGDAATKLYTESAGVYTAYTTYDSGVTNVYTAKSTTNSTATLFNTATALPTSGKIEVSYPVVGATAKAATAPGYNKANVEVTAGATSSNTQEFGALAAGTMVAKEHKEEAGTDKNYIGRHSNEATFAGALADDYFQAVIPNNEGQSLTLRVNYTLVSTDGSEEEIKVWGAKAVVPATFTAWQPNYAYTYLFKISDKSNGSTEELGGTENLFPITFDAVVEEATDATAEQTTITTVATPSITTYQKGHNYKDTDSYLASKETIYTLVKKADGSLAEDLDTKGQLYTVTGTAISEASVTDALLKTVSGSADVNGRNGIALTEATSTVGNSYVALDGKTVTLTETNCVASFTPVAPVSPATVAYYAYVYKVADATLTYEAYQPVAVTVGTTDVDNYKSITWATIAGTSDLAANETADKDYLYFQVTKNGAGTETHYSYITVIPGVTTVAAGEGVKKIAKADLTDAAAGKAVASTFYFDVYTVNNAQYGVKVINVQ